MQNEPKGATAEGTPAISRRAALRTLLAGSAVGAVTAGAVIVASPAAPARAAEPDPSLAAIARHKQAWAAWQALKDENDPRAEALDKAEQDAWEEVTQIVPTTAYGLSAMSSHVAMQLGRDAMPSEQSMQAALLTISWAAASLHYRGEAA